MTGAILKNVEHGKTYSVQFKRSLFFKIKTIVNFFVNLLIFLLKKNFNLINYQGEGSCFNLINYNERFQINECVFKDIKILQGQGQVEIYFIQTKLKIFQKFENNIFLDIRNLLHIWWDFINRVL